MVTASGMTTKQAMQMTFIFAKLNFEKFSESWTKNNCVGQDWIRDFL